MNEITYTTKARYFTHGDLNKASHLLFVLHGYGQLAQFFIRKFDHIDPNKYYIVAPEGPHRFYQKGSAGRVGASWMTKENREQDIENYISYLTAIYNHITAKKEFNSKRLLGFSQGGATASRWHGSGKVEFDEFILWAAVFPPDMPLNYQKSFSKSKNHFVFGNNDEFYSLDKAKEHLAEIKSLGLIFDFHNFEGNHDIHKETVSKLLND